VFVHVHFFFFLNGEGGSSLKFGKILCYTFNFSTNISRRFQFLMLMHSVGFDSENVCQEMKWSVHQRYPYKCIKAEQHNVEP